MKTVFVLSLVVAVAIAQRLSNPTPRPESTEAPSTLRCSDAFSIFHECHIECIMMQVDGCPGCNATCNQLLTDRDGRCPDIGRCSRGCPLSRDPETRCRICECEERDSEESAENLRDPCRVNATYFALLGSCNPRCVERRDDDGCFMCNRECNATGSNQEGDQNQCGIRDGDECDEGSVCLLEGILNLCIRMPGVGDSCERRRSNQEDQDGEDDNDDDELDESDSDFFTRIEGVRDRLRVYSLPFSAESEVPCSNGTYCSYQGQCLLIRGPCIDRMASDAQIRCDDDGNFEPLQCRRMDDGTHTCRCVHPGNGSMVPNTMRTGIRRREDAPDCEARGIGLAKPPSLMCSY